MSVSFLASSSLALKLMEGPLMHETLTILNLHQLQKLRVEVLPKELQEICVEAIFQDGDNKYSYKNKSKTKKEREEIVKRGKGLKV